MKTKILLKQFILSLQSLFLITLVAYSQPTKQWDKNFSGNVDDFLHSIQQTTDDTYILVDFHSQAVAIKHKLIRNKQLLDFKQIVAVQNNGI